ncbi:hypothetical protein [Rhizobium laguerreae]|uniref:hypothetical protein n=1 Tax=Rhizobium laguerreae TaxID=1076926 RepID=UPI001C902E3F|nr:hypothetical protein [Rhizobium laguerreae]MBY3138988.1 hypothetical protein [Rhizobium laguerreae]
MGWQEDETFGDGMNSNGDMRDHVCRRDEAEICNQNDPAVLIRRGMVAQHSKETLNAFFE